MKFGIVGTNFVSDAFMDGIANVAEAEVTIVCSRRLENAQRFAKRYEIETYCDRYEDMLETDMDAVYIAVPNQLHYEVAHFFLSKKIPVFLEKPMCVNYKQASALIAYAQAQKTYLHDGLMPLYTPSLQAIKTTLPQLGTLHQASFHFAKVSSRYQAYLQGESPTTFQKALANGAMMDLGIYAVGVAVALFGKPKTILATCNVLASGVDGASSIVFGYETLQLVIQVSKINDTCSKSEICGELGVLELDVLSLLEQVTLHQRNQADRNVATHSTNPFVYQIADFIHCVKEKRDSNYLPYALSLDILEVLTQARLVAGMRYDEDDVENID
ncbi:MAG: Gfo/Idh/MocA family protein [Erysipelotrichaceae bacterium]